MIGDWLPAGNSHGHPAWRPAGYPLEFPVAVDTATQRSRVRFWEHDGSGGTLSGSVRSGHRARLDVSDVQERPMTAALHERALSSHRGGQGSKSPRSTKY